MINNNEANRRFYSLFTAAVMVLVHAALIYIVLHYNYNQDFRTQLYLKGHLLVLGIYVFCYTGLAKVFGGILIGDRRNAEIMFSELFTCIFSNFIFYLIIMMYSFKFPTLVPLMGAMLLQLVFSAVWIKISGAIYKKLYKPYKVLLIYDGNGIESFLKKLDTRKDKLVVSDKVCADQGLDAIFEKIDETNTVILWDLEVTQRNIIFKYCYEKSKRIFMAPKISDIIFAGSKSLHMFDTPLLLTEGNPLNYEERVIKRIIDILMALVLIVLTSPFMLGTAIAIKLCDGGPVLYKQIRCTKNNRQFKIMKFRSMVVDAEKKNGAQLAKENDDRITPVGRVIRKVRLDELPQLFNVLKGDMSFVGPRPERPEFIEKYVKDMPEFAYRTKVQAGITGYAQLYGKYNTVPYDKVKLDLYYIENYSLWLDIKLMILTAKILFTMESTEGTAETVTAEKSNVR